MRLILWIVQTLITRSWLIAGGVALGMIARSLVPNTVDEKSTDSIVIPEAKAAYDQMMEKEEKAREIQEVKSQAEREQAELDRIGDFEIIGRD